MGLAEWLTLAGIVVTALMSWRRFGRSVRVSADEVSGPTTVEYGFSQNSVRVVVVNSGGASVEIGDIRLMFGRKFGDLYTQLDTKSSLLDPFARRGASEATMKSSIAMFRHS